MCGVTGMLKSVDQDTVYTRFQSENTLIVKNVLLVCVAHKT